MTLQNVLLFAMPFYDNPLFHVLKVFEILHSVSVPPFIFNPRQMK